MLSNGCGAFGCWISLIAFLVFILRFSPAMSDMLYFAFEVLQFQGEENRQNADLLYMRGVFESVR